MVPELIDCLTDHTKDPNEALEQLYDHFSQDPKFPDMKNPHVASMHEILLKLMAVTQTSASTVERVKNFAVGKLLSLNYKLSFNNNFQIFCFRTIRLQPVNGSGYAARG